MSRLRLLALLVLALAGCEPQPLLVLSLSGVPTDTEVLIVRGEDDTPDAETTFPGPQQRVGLRLAAGYSGPIHVVVLANRGDCTLARGELTAQITDPGRTDLALALRPDATCGGAGPYPLSVAVEDQGTVLSGDGRVRCGPACAPVSYPAGARVHLAVEPAAARYFGGWSGDCAGQALTCDLTMDRPRSVGARFTPANLVFVTSMSYSIPQVRVLGSGATTAEKMVSGADRICSERAQAAGLPGRYLAWLSTRATAASSRVRATGARGWVRPDGRPFTDQMESYVRVLYPPDVDELGATAGNAQAFTGTGDGGGYTDDAGCNDWSDTSMATSTVVGDSGFSGMRWSRHWYGSCGNGYRLYCFGVDRQAVVQSPPPPPGSKLLFISSRPQPATAGVAAADALCGQDGQGLRPGGRFSAVLGTSATSAASRFDARSGAPLYRPDGVRVAAWHGQLFADMPHLDAAPNVNSRGDYVNFAFIWSGSPTPVSTGAADITCRDWSSGDMTAKGRIGLINANHNGLFSNSDDVCSQSLFVLCLEK